MVKKKVLLYRKCCDTNYECWVVCKPKLTCSVKGECLFSCCLQICIATLFFFFCFVFLGVFVLFCLVFVCLFWGFWRFFLFGLVLGFFFPSRQHRN
uniref:Uncharacterized protein n=1 Tax=Cyanistes caeruleus TaxID=156563 RepID=A0A8C0U2X3_CYACU